MHDESGPAFPTLNHPGMTLRDWFASQALNGLIAANLLSTAVQMGASADAGMAHLCRGAYALADEMLKARQR